MMQMFAKQHASADSAFYIPYVYPQSGLQDPADVTGPGINSGGRLEEPSLRVLSTPPHVFARAGCLQT